MAEPSPSVPDALNTLAEEFMERFRRGERPSLTEYTSKHPKLAEEIRELFPALVVMEDLGSVAGQPALPRPGPVPEQLGDFRILREIGRGGMGVVYEAVQESLGRHVALKVLPFHGLLDATQLERFRREARAVARLHHTNIVPVFGVGECDGIHYYAMQYIQGQSLDEVIGEVKRLRKGNAFTPETVSRQANDNVAEALLTGQFKAADLADDVPDPNNKAPEPCADGSAKEGPTDSGHGSLPFASVATHSTALLSGSSSELTSQSEVQYFRSVARLGVQTAEGLEYAHQQGVLHRDIKPSNLLLDLHGTVWITDFGLAKADDSGELTVTGDIIGTVRYMPPERLDGRSEPRSDIYSLGITLYEMLTLQPAFADSQRARLMHRIMKEDPPKPRKFDPAIPQDLETIVLKAIAKEPGQRYATAQDMAEDLRRFLADRPIQARRSALWERTWRWCRRNPTIASLSGLAAVLLVTLGIGSVVTTLIRLERDRAIAAEVRAESAEHLAQMMAYRKSGRGGQRFLCLDEAAKLPPLHPSDELRRKLRTQVVACLALPDLYLDLQWDGYPAGSVSVDFDDTLEIYARTDEQGNCSIRRVANDEEVVHLPGLGQPAWGSLSRDGRFVAVGAKDGPLLVWKLDSPEPTVLFKESFVSRGPNFRLDSRQLALAHTDGTISVYDLSTGQCLHRLPREGFQREMILALHPTEPLIAVCSYFSREVQLRDLRTGAVKVLRHPVGVSHVDWHPDGQTLATACGDEPTIRFFDKATLKLIRTLEATNLGLRIAFNHAGDRLVSQGWGGNLQLWNVATGQLLFTTAPITAGALRFSRDDCRLAGSIQSHQLGIWQVGDGREYRTLVRTSLPKNAYPTSVAVHKDGRLLAVAMNDGLAFWDLATSTELDFIPISEGINTLLFEASGSLLTNGSSGLFRWPVQRDPVANDSLRIGPPERLSLPGVNGLIAQSLDGRVLVQAHRAAGRDAHRAGAWVLHADRAVKPFRLDAGADVATVDVSPDGRWIATGLHGGSTIKVWEARTGQLVKQQSGERYATCRFSPDGRWLATGVDGNHLWAVGSWAQGPRIGEGSLSTSAFSPDSSLIAVESGIGAIRLVDTVSGDELALLEDPNLDLGNPIFTRDGTQLISLTQSNVRGVHIWDLRSIRQQLATLGLDWDQDPYPPAVGVVTTTPIHLVLDTRGLSIGSELGVDVWSLVIAFQPLNWEAYYQRALTHAAHRRYQDAVTDCQQALAWPVDWQTLIAKTPARGNALNNLAWTFASKSASNKEIQFAVALAEQAVKLDETKATSHNTLGVAYYRAGRFRDAMTALETSLKIGDGQADAYDLYFLAMCHHRLRDAGQARACFDQAVLWRKKQKKLPLESMQELDVFHAEAVALVGLRDEPRP